MADELSAPLLRRSDRRNKGLKALEARFPISRLPLARIALGLIVLIVGGAVLRVVLVDDPTGGRPSATAPINSTRDANELASELAPAQPGRPVTITADPDEIPASGPSITELDDLPPPTATQTASSPGLDGLIPNLLEKTDDGPIPRIAADGTTPFAAYARSDPAMVADAGPKIAIVVTGMGLSENGTLSAIDALPAAVTLAFAPYGKTLDRTVPAARASGHELLLEVPLEPFDYPDNDPGPETLLTGQPPRANIDKLVWLMARFGGYVGLINNMGARFTSSAADFSPMMEELGARGLGYVDDGSSNRSLAATLSTANAVPFARGSVLIDANPAAGHIRAELDALEAKAISDGSAIGIATALPVTISTLAEWSKELKERGVTLVPVSALMKAGS